VEVGKMSKLMKPLFIDGNFNREGKRIRANYLRTVGEYPLWINDGKPDNDYARHEEDKYYLYIQVGEWLAPIGYTEHKIKERAGYEYLNKQWYGDFEKRNKFFDELRANKSWEEGNKVVTEQIAKEEKFVKEHINDEVIAEFLDKEIESAIKVYNESKESEGKTFPNYVGALFLNDLEKCEQLAVTYKAEREKKEQERKRVIAEQKAKEAKEQAKAEKLLIEEAENIFINGGTIKGGDIIVKLADKYNINIPIRTRGWILNSLAESTITVGDYVSYSYRYWKSKGATGSQKVYDILGDIHNTLTA
jgi:hypothetical protein